MKGTHDTEPLLHHFRQGSMNRRELIRHALAAGWEPERIPGRTPRSTRRSELP